MNKAGLKTSELWVAVGVMLTTVLNNKLGLGLNPEEVAAVCGLAAVYVAKRGWVKTHAVAGEPPVAVRTSGSEL